MSEIDLGEFMKFCKDFEIALPKHKQQEVFKKCSIGHRPHKFEQFLNALGRLSLELNLAKLLELDDKLKELRRELRKQEQRANEGGSRLQQMSEDDQFTREGGNPSALESHGGYGDVESRNRSQLSGQQRSVNEEGGNQFRPGISPRCSTEARASKRTSSTAEAMRASSWRETSS